MNLCVYMFGLKNSNKKIHKVRQQFYSKKTRGGKNFIKFKYNTIDP